MYHGIRIDRPSFVPFVPAVPVVRNVRAVDACEYTEALDPAMLGVFLPRVDMLETLPESLSQTVLRPCYQLVIPGIVVQVVLFYRFSRQETWDPARGLSWYGCVWYTHGYLVHRVSCVS